MRPIARTKAERAMTGDRYGWQFMNVLGTWMPFNDANNQEAEVAYTKRKGKGTCKYTVNCIEAPDSTYVLHFNGGINMYQIDAVTRVRQTVKRVKGKKIRTITDGATAAAAVPQRRRVAAESRTLAEESSAPAPIGVDVALPLSLKKLKKGKARGFAKKMPAPVEAEPPTQQPTLEIQTQGGDSGEGGAKGWRSPDRKSPTDTQNNLDTRVHSEGDKLIRAAGVGKSEEVDRLLANGIAVNYADSYGRTPLINASLKGHAAIVSALLYANADVHKADNYGATALMKAMIHRNPEAAAHLHAAGALLSEKDNGVVMGEQLGNAASCGKSQAMFELVAKGVDVNYVDKTYGWTPLTQASTAGHIQAVNTLLVARADVNKVDKGGRTALYHAMTIGHADVELCLREAGAVLSENDNVTIWANKRKHMAKELVRAAEYGKFEDAKVLIENRADVNYTEEKYGDTPLLRASYNGHIGIVVALLAADATKSHVDKANKNGVTALMKAAEYGHAKIVTALLSANADVLKADKDGRIPLAHAIVSGNPEVKDILRAARVCASLTKDGSTIEMGERLWTAAKDGNTVEVDALISRGAKLNYNGGLQGDSPLMKASGSGHMHIVASLLAANANVNKTNTDWSTALLGASSSGHALIAHQLILSGANIHTTNKIGETAAQCARKNTHSELAAQLEAAASPPLLLTTATGAPVATPHSVHLFAAGIPFQPHPQPAHHTIIHHEELLLTEVGPWLGGVALSQAESNLPSTNKLVVTVINRACSIASTISPHVAEKFFTEFLLPSAQVQLVEMPAQLHKIARKMEANFISVPDALRDHPDHKVELNQGNCLAFMKPEHSNVVDEVLAECTPKFVRMRTEAEEAVEDLADSSGPGVGFSDTYANVHLVDSLPTKIEVFVAALCLVSTFLFAHFQTTRSEFRNAGKGKKDGGDASSDIRLPDVKTMQQMFAEVRDKSTDSSQPWATLLDTVQFSLVLKAQGQYANFVKRFLPHTGSGGGGGGGAASGAQRTLTLDRSAGRKLGIGLGDAKYKCAVPIVWVDSGGQASALLTTDDSVVAINGKDVRGKSSSKAGKFVKDVEVVVLTLGEPDAALYSKIAAASLESAKDASSVARSLSNLPAGNAKDAELTLARAKNAIDTPDATVNEEFWNLTYKPTDLTFQAMLGEGGLNEVRSADRWKEYGDVEWKETSMYGRDQTHLNRITTFKPRNPLFKAAITTAKNTNPATSPYVWEAALKLVAHPSFTVQPVAMIIEVQLYREEFLEYQKLVSCLYNITQAPTLASLGPDFLKDAETVSSQESAVVTDYVEGKVAVGQVLEMNDRVRTSLGKIGTIAYLGGTEFASGSWVGVALSKSGGKNDGSVEGVRYFRCRPNHGAFVRPESLRILKKHPPTAKDRTFTSPFLKR